jgi:hypothetical protein
MSARLLVACCVPAIFWAGSFVVAQRPSGDVTSTGLVLGRVVDGSTALAIPSVTVYLRSVNPSTRQETALTGPDGQFVFMNLPAGEFTLSASKSGYTGGGFGQRRPNGGSVSLRLANQERAGGVTLRMWRTGFISGRVTDDLGAPVSGVRVETIRTLVAADDFSSGTGPSDVTKADGTYRIRIAPGEYILRVSAFAMSIPMPASVGPASPNASESYGPGHALIVDATGRNFLTTMGASPRAGTPSEKPVMFLTTYSGGAKDQPHATTVRVQSGEEVSGIDISLATSSGVRVTGVITGPNGPVAGAMVRLLPTGADPRDTSSRSEAASAISAEDGAFIFLLAPIGDYRLNAYRPDPPLNGVRLSPTGMPQRFGSDVISINADGWIADMPLSIADDVTGLTLSMQRLEPITGVAVSGSVEFDHPMVFSNGRALSPFYISLNGLTSGGLSEAIRADVPGPFVIRSVPPGRYEMHAGPILQGWSIVGATVGGRDVFGAPLEVGPGGITGLTIRISDRLNTVTGTVTDAQGRAVRDPSIVLVPTDRRSWPRVTKQYQTRLRYERSGQPKYTMTDFPDGEYFVAAIDDALMENWPSPALIEKIAALATRLDVRGGATRTQDLRLITVLK